ncbi:TPA: VapC toxin family PIN domain ribonuclease [Candidatus Daviesbacteria bacterium]|uniref:PIN domain-containing addiction module n=1 Tax=Candidatus Daviesbacteria bacterium GW2011_GWF2_38_6 TaxID=1618432 RepID=A0A0G0KJT8_9BACT|nr:MAG: PIN domain-containing addiction module [Candidatus Daviesbacteria bacterium GW2011_GWF2_38_6]OGE27295.1 MAG: hypothetical protein A3D02_01445 [Candidatus Daviesbacteria bacterium RIFCSPHIGHO2_02_FULL_39_41]OGE28152.1 MAG: hypothetical protein A2772_01070 [Candidatus Daviesbacteria bacterium RIFCSPHIGHO2_01_FULL_38_8b]OGE45864.1 MAG: hypothetical protein A3E67_03670 [Candidatus Daviesbacteria bacterium RIFCSPHIGHO2_12_FULL_38_25]OGE68155.1 MAG: hypothetical protein A3H81_03115 [Candidatu
MIVLDTNALLWWINDSGRLSGKARKIIEEEEKKKAIFVSSISVLEICTLVKKGRLEFVALTDNWLDQVESLSCLHFVPVDNQTAKTSVNLPDFTHKDPADRIIIATAMINGATLITSDKKILNYTHVKAVW